MSTETLSKSDKFNELNKHKCNVAVLKKRLVMEKKKEIFQNRIVLLTFCLSLGIIGYFVI